MGSGEVNACLKRAESCLFSRPAQVYYSPLACPSIQLSQGYSSIFHPVHHPSSRPSCTLVINHHSITLTMDDFSVAMDIVNADCDFEVESQQTFVRDLVEHPSTNTANLVNSISSPSYPLRFASRFGT